MGLSVLWFWVVVLLMAALLAAGIGGGIAGGMKVKKNKEHDQKHGNEQSNSDKSNITSPCQDNPYINNTIVSVAQVMLKSANSESFVIELLIGTSVSTS
ncbi:hypothetical protein DID88_009036 [Monilinia fructigena]|uniref:Uncharacterized protein n=1 Tax=Monilinia fructigena TaxID=38457 RepID=A0A395IF49_9HELO|nr:hypothetical protein DID88_009036 [Monilinia fructigena]